MSIKQALIEVQGIAPLLQNNPQTVDRFNEYTKRMAQINAKKTRRTDDDYEELRDLEMRSKIYWSDEIGIYVPTTWMSAAIAANSFKVAKFPKAEVRASVFMVEDKSALRYRDMDKVRGPEDLVKNNVFRHLMAVKQQQNRVMKATPIFHEWSFSVDLEFDDKFLDPDSLERIVKYGAKYGGFGDFRPTFGRASAEVKIG